MIVHAFVTTMNSDMFGSRRLVFSLDSSDKQHEEQPE